MARLLGDRMEQKRAAGDRLQMFIRMGQTHKERPPIVDQGNDPRHEAASLNILRGVPTPAPLILQLIKDVLGVRSITVVLRDGENLVLECGR